MVLGYGVMSAISIILIVLYQTLIKNKEFWLGLLFVCVAVVNLGYFALSLAKSVEFAIIANDISYLGSVFLSTCMLFTIAKLCGFTIKKPVVIVLVVVAFLMFLIIATSGILPWYYKSVSIETVNGATVLKKEYGVLHPVYLIYLVAYFVAMLGAIIYSVITKKGASPKFAGAVAVIVLINLTVWFLEKFAIRGFEFLSVSYVVSEVLFVLLYWMMQDYISINELNSQSSAHNTVVVVDSLDRAEKLRVIIAKLPSGVQLTTRQTEILEGILDGKSRREISVDLHLSENTVKTHITALYDILGVSSKDEIFKLFSKN